MIRFLRQEFQFILTNVRTKNSFVSDFSFLFSEKLITILLSFVVTPIITRLYSPNAYGYFSIFNAFAISFSVICCLSYDSALVVIKEEKKFYNLFFACVTASFFCGCLLFIGLFLTKETPYFFQVFSSSGSDSTSFIWLLTFGCILYSVTQLQPKWNVRRKQFRFAALVGVISNLASRSMALLLGFVYSAPILGIVLSELFGKCTAFVLSATKNVWHERKEFINSISFKGLKQVLAEQIAYPKYILPGRYVGLLTIQLPIYFFTFFSGAEVVGNFALAQSILTLPVLLISNTLNPIFLKKISELSENQELLRSLLYRAIKLLTIICLPFFIFLVLFSQNLFPFIFGSNWHVAGKIAGILSLFLIVDMLNAFTGPIFLVFKKERKLFFLKSIQLIVTFLSMLPGYFKGDYFIALFGYGLSYYVFGWIQISKALSIIDLFIYKIIIFITITLLVPFIYMFIF